MIKDDELMRGDFVMFFDQHKIGHIAIVDQAMRYSCLLLYKGPDDETYESEIIVNYEDIHPIKVTEELLEKNGFKKWTWYRHHLDDTVTYGVGGGCHVEIETIDDEKIFNLVDSCSDSGDYGYVRNYLCDATYIHLLQHAFKLFEIEHKFVF